MWQDLWTYYLRAYKLSYEHIIPNTVFITVTSDKTSSSAFQHIPAPVSASYHVALLCCVNHTQLTLPDTFILSAAMINIKLSRCYFYIVLFHVHLTAPIFSDCVNIVLNSNFSLNGVLFGKTGNLCIRVQRGDGGLCFSPHILVCTCLPGEPLLFPVVKSSREISGIKGHCLLADLMFPFVTVTCWGQSLFVFDSAVWSGISIWTCISRVPRRKWMCYLTSKLL